jgi:hypothetical protein
MALWTHNLPSQSLKREYSVFDEAVSLYERPFERIFYTLGTEKIYLNEFTVVMI